MAIVGEELAGQHNRPGSQGPLDPWRGSEVLGAAWAQARLRTTRRGRRYPQCRPIGRHGYAREGGRRTNKVTGSLRCVPPSGEVAASSATNAVLFFRDALTAELNQQREAPQAILDQSQQLLTNNHSLSDQARSLQQSAEEAARMRSQWQTLTSRLDRLERRLRETEAAPATTLPPDTNKWFRR